jgi:hypothetical protein
VGEAQDHLDVRDGVRLQIVKNNLTFPSEEPLEAAPIMRAEQYRFNCTDVKIAVAGSEKRTGVTKTAFNLVCRLNSRGASACYLEANTRLNCLSFNEEGAIRLIDKTSSRSLAFWPLLLWFLISNVFVVYWVINIPKAVQVA